MGILFPVALLLSQRNNEYSTIIAHSQDTTLFLQI